MAWYLLPLFITITGCSLQKMALRSSTPIFEKSSASLMQEGNWEFFAASTPGNLKFLELIYLQDKENLKLLGVLVKGYAGYAFAVHETLAFEDSLKEIENSAAKEDAITFYTRALDYGLLYLDKKGISSKDLLANDEKKLHEKLQDLDEEDAYALLYTGQAWGSLINLQKDNVALVSQIPKVKSLFDRVCEINPNIDNNVCEIFYAQYEVSRPKMLGGNPEKGEKLFLDAIEKNPKNLLLRLTYIQYVALPSFDEEKYEKHALVLKEEFPKWLDNNRDSLENKSPYKGYEALNLYNSIAKKRFEIIEKYKNKIF